MKDKSMQQGDNLIIFFSNAKCSFGCANPQKDSNIPPYINNPAGASEGGCSEVIDSIEHSELNVCKM